MISLEILNNLLTEEIENYCMSMYVDTRLKLSLYDQHIEEPFGLQKAIIFVSNNNSLLASLIKKDGIDKNNTNTDLSNIIDPYRFIALYALNKKGLTI